MLVARQDDRLTATLIDVRPLPGIRAGSGLARWRDRLIIVQDDALAVVTLDVSTGHTTLTPLSGPGTALSKADKPDFEAIFAGDDDTFWLVGSGSKANRRRWGHVAPATGAVALFDATELYENIARALGCTPNIEGAVRVGKVEGLVLDADGRSGYVITDPDDPAHPAELARLVLTGPW